MRGARGVLINITGGLDMTLYEVDAAANRIREEVDGDANIIFGSTFDNSLQGRMRVSVVATGIDLPHRAGHHGPGGVAQEPVAEPPRAGAGPFRFQPQRVQPVPSHPSQAEAAAAPAGRSSAPPRTCARRAEPCSAAAEPDSAADEILGCRTPTAGQQAARAEERAPQPVRAGQGVRVHPLRRERPVERHAPRLRRAQRPTASGGQAALAGNMDEIGDIPSFLRRERERVDG